MLNSDLPIKKTDDDVLNRASFVESLAKVMLDYALPEGFAIGIYGKWGSGKTSVINMLLEKIDAMSNSSQQKPVVLRFNPWLCSDSKQLISQFFKQLSSAIKMKQPHLEKVANFMSDYADTFEIAGSIPVAGNILSAVGKILGKKAKEYADKKSSDLQSIKDKIISTLQKEKIKIVVTIDDVDRLSNEEIISVFQLVKSLADFPYTVYLLAFDRDVVVGALKDVQHGDGAEYLEKIIQVPFELPAPNADDIHQVFFTKLNSIVTISDDKWDKEYWSEMFHFGIKPYLKSIRDVVRYSNTFALKYSLLKDETYLIDLLGLTCVQVFEPEVYSRLPRQKEHLCGGEVYHDPKLRQSENEKALKAYNFIIAGLADEKVEICKNILIKLFPKLNSISSLLSEFGLGYSRNYNYYEALGRGYISCSECFDRYFSLTLEATAIPQHEINYLLFQADANELVEGLVKIYSVRKTRRILDHICATFDSKKEMSNYEDRAILIFKCISLFWHKLDDEEETSFFSMPLSWRLLLVAENLLKVIHTSKRFELMSSIFNDVNIDISTLLEILRNFESQHNRFTEKESNQLEQLITLEELLELEKIFINRVIGEFESGEILNNDSASYVIWFFEKLDEETAKLYTDNMIDSDLSLARLISAFVGHGKVAGRTVWKIWRVRRNDIEKYVVIDDAYSKMMEFSHTIEFKQLSKAKQENICAFLIDIERDDQRSSMGDGIVISAIEKRLKEIDGYHINFVYT